jgi:ABC-type cobalamin/Fe3+-siderophores transport system ATPase subunit
VRIARIFAIPAAVSSARSSQHPDLAHQAHVCTDCLQARDHAAASVMVLHELLWIVPTCTHVLILGEDGEAHSGPAPEILTCERVKQAYGRRLREVDHGGALLRPHV